MNSCIQPYGYNPDIANWSLFYECSFITSFILFIKPRNLCVILRIYWNSVWRTINSIASVLCENVYGYFSLDIICSSKLTVYSSFALEKLFASSSWTDKACEQISVRFLAPNRSYCLLSSEFSISLIKLYFIEKQIIFFFPFCSSLEEDANFFCFVVAGIDWSRTVIYASFQWSTRARCDIIFQLKRKKLS